jgi:O-antigen/teichoic acid export membrane protein
LGNTSVRLSRDLFIQLYFYSFLVQGFLCVVLFFVYDRKSVQIVLPASGEWSQVLNYASKAFAANLLAFLLTRVDYWLIEFLTNDHAALGNYIQASRLVQLFQMLPVILATTVFPAVSSGRRSGMVEVIQTLSRLLLVFYLALIIVLACVGQWLFPLIFGASFSEMYPVFLLLSPGLIATMVMALICSYLAAINKIQRNIWVSVAGLAFILPVDAIVIPWAGITGAAIVCSIGYCISFVTAFYFLKKETDVLLKDFIVLRTTDITFLLSKLNFTNRNAGG